MSLTDDKPQLVPLSAAYLDEIVEIEARSYEHPWSAAMFLDAIKYDCFGSVAILDSRAVGYTVLQSAAHELHILNIAVDPDARRKKIGTLLMQDSLAAAERASATVIYLEVRVSNYAAIHLYEQFGFEMSARRKRYYPNGEDAFVMHKLLTSVDSDPVDLSKNNQDLN